MIGLGAGIKAHRAIKTMCQVIGINDLFAKVEGGKRNVQNMTKALFNGLRDQVSIMSRTWCICYVHVKILKCSCTNFPRPFLHMHNISVHGTHSFLMCMMHLHYM